jgi:hypothetical protein
VLRFPQHAALIYIIVVPDMHGQKADTGNYQIATAAPGGSRIDSIKRRQSFAPGHECEVNSHSMAKMTIVPAKT